MFEDTKEVSSSC